LFLPETKGLSLEEMDILFKVVDEPVRRHDIEGHIAGAQPTEEKAPVGSSSSSKDARVEATTTDTSVYRD
jgi:hypothetical protein